MKTEYQLAQKIHALSTAQSRRAHDLVDLQVIMKNEAVDFVLLKTICTRLFSYRRMQKWPPVVNCGKSWDSLYDTAAKGLDVLSDVDDSVDWVNDLIKRIDAVDSL